MDPFSLEAVRAAYDAVSSDYVEAFGDDLDRLPVDRAMLDRAATACGTGLALDVGCGPGTVGAYLRDRGVTALGLDLSLGMLRFASTRSQLPAVQADMRSMPFGDDVFALVVAYYSIHHIPRAEIGVALDEVARVLRPGGLLLLATHLGTGEKYVSEFLGHEIPSVGGTLYSSIEIAEYLVSPGFAIETEEWRWPLEHEYPSQRIYLLARLLADS